MSTSKPAIQMFVPFIYRLRKHGVPVGAQEAIALGNALKRGLHENSLDGFYHVARALLVHNEGHLDAFDQAFLAEFRGVEGKFEKLKSELLQWLEQAKVRWEDLTDEERALAEQLDPEEIKRLFEQAGERGEGEQGEPGNRWRARQGDGDKNQDGRKGQGSQRGKGDARGGRSAIQSADARRYRRYRSDVTLDVRQMEMALRRLRAYTREGGEEELDLQRTIDETARNAGELEVCTRPPRRPNTRVILMMDVGGSMDPYVEMMSRLFSATKKATHWKELRTYYFHNCVYGRVYRTDKFDEPMYVTDLLHECGRDHKLVMVGDALMAPYELMRQGGALSATDRSSLTGISWLLMLKEYFRHSVWLNPEPPNYWEGTTIQTVRGVFDMHHLTLEGLSTAMTQLNRGSKR